MANRFRISNFCIAQITSHLFASVYQRHSMKPFIFLNFIICSIGCISSIEQRDGLALGFTHDVDTKVKVLVNNFVVLPAEIKKIILGHLSVGELCEFIQNAEFKEYHHLATEAYGLTYGNTPVFTRGSKLMSNSLKDSTIHFNDHREFLSFLSTFHKYVKNLKIDFSGFTDDDLFELIEFIEKFNAKTVTRFEFRRINGEQFNLMEIIAFRNLKELSFFACSFENQILDLKYSFPNVRQLSLKITTFTDRTWIENSFKHLTKLLVSIHRDRFWEEDLISTLNNNLEVDTLGIIDCTPNLLREINDRFSNVKNLGLMGVSNEFLTTLEIHMQFVQKFLFVGMIQSELPIHFEHLEELEWHSRAQPEIALLDIVQGHRKTIEVLNIRKTLLQDHHLTQMQNITQLRKLSVHFEEGTKTMMTANGISQFITSNEHLEEIQIFGATQILREDLCERLEQLRHSKNFNRSGWIQISNSKTNNGGLVHIIIKSMRNDKSMNQREMNNDSMDFLRNNFY